MSELISKVMISSVLVLIVIIIIYFIIKVIVLSVEILKHGKIYSKIIKLNNLYNFYNTTSKINIFDSISTLRQIRKIIPDIRIYYAIENNELGIKYELQKIALNTEMFKHYNNEYKKIINLIEHNTLKGKIEKIMCGLKQKRIKTNFCITYNANYVSPAGRSRASIDRKYNYEQLVSICEYYKSEEKKKELKRMFIGNERAKMSDSLRYNVLKRDNYRCKICGSTSADGIKLHVDHIIPVSKGGKTELSNLQTLCERCNIGKSNKI